MRDFYAEAVQIVKGETQIVVEKEHLVALYDRLDIAGLTEEAQEEVRALKAFARMEEAFWDSRANT